MLLLLVFEAAVYRRQEYYRRQHQLVPPATEAIFEEGTHARLDQGLLPCAQYFLNYFYYKFGLEVSSGGGVPRSSKHLQRGRQEVPG